MKIHILTIFLFHIITNTFAQKVCSCSVKESLSEVLDCKDIILKNRSKLYWQFNCDSSWLTFKNRFGSKKMMYSSEFVEYTGRLGYSYATEYKNGFLVRNGLISGCCTPPEYILFNKNTGKEILNFGPLIYYSEDYYTPVIVYYDRNALIVYNIVTKKRSTIRLEEGSIERTVKSGTEQHPENLFDAELKNNVLKVEYRYLKVKNNNMWIKKILKIDLTKYKG